MCLVGFVWKTHPRWPLVMVGNRDEMHDRPSAALAAWADAPVLAGRDLRSGGTWMGLGPDGRVAVVTNVRDGLPTPFAGPSRGDLPTAFLTGTADALTHARAIAAGAARYAPFNLVLADMENCAYLGNHPPQGVRMVAAGAHALSNGPFDAPWPKTTHLQGVLRDWAASASEALDPLWAALADRRAAPDLALPQTGIPLDMERQLSCAFVSGDRYGTRASTLVLIDHAGHGTIIERRYGPEGAFLGETTLESGR